MTRSQALRNLLRCVFGNITLSVEDGKIVKGVSMYANCNYTIKSYNNFEALFKITFIDPEPMYSDLSLFDRDKAMINSRKYLSSYGIEIDADMTDKKQRELIFDIFKSFLKVIIVDDKGNSKTIAKDKDITYDIIKIIDDIQKGINIKQSLSNPIEVWKLAYGLDYIELVDSKYKNQPDKCNYSMIIDCQGVEAYRVLMLLRNIQVAIPFTSNTVIKSDGEEMSLTHDILAGRFNNKNNFKREFYFCPVKFFSDSNELSSIIKWKFNTYVDEETIIAEAKSKSLCNTLYDFTNEITARAEQEVEEKFIEKLQPFYEHNCSYLEKLITSIISLKGCPIDFNSTEISRSLEDFLYNKCEQVLWNFEQPCLRIEQSYRENLSLGLYITLQNVMIELTEILNDKGSDIARYFKMMLTPDIFRKHIKYIKKTIDSKEIETLKSLEKEFKNEHKDLFKKPRFVDDYFYNLQEHTFYNFQSSMYKYYSELSAENRKN